MKVESRLFTILKRLSLLLRKVSLLCQADSGCNCCTLVKCLRINLGSKAILTGPATARTQALLSQTVEQTVHDLLDRERTIQQLRAMQDSEAQSIEALQRDLQDQERKAEFSTPGGRVLGCRSSLPRFKTYSDKSVTGIKRSKSSQVNWKPSSVSIRK